MQLIVSAEAEADILSILDYIEKEAGTTVAHAYGEKFAVTIERLWDFPESGMLKPALGPNARTIVIYPYVLIYDYIEDNGILFVLRALHGKRKITHKLLQEY